MDKVRELEPDWDSLKSLLRELNAFLVIVTARDGDQFDYVFRVFNQMDEDHGCGVAQCVLGPYWGAKLGVSGMRSLQPTVKGSMMSVEVVENGVRITGSVSPLIKGTLAL